MLSLICQVSTRSSRPFSLKKKEGKETEARASARGGVGGMQKEETGTALTQQNWEQFRVLLKISSGGHRNPSVSWMTGHLRFIQHHTKHQLEREPAGRTANITGLQSPAPQMCMKQTRHHALHASKACKGTAAYMDCRGGGGRSKICPSGYCQLAFKF